MENIKEVIKEYATVGVVMSCFMFAIRTYVSVRQSVRDTAIVFLFTVLSGIILENFDVSEYLKVGLSGCVGFWAVEIYKIIFNVLNHVEKHPEIIVNKIIKRRRTKKVIDDE